MRRHVQAPGSRQRIDGLLLVDKPVGPSSNAVLQRVKRLYRAAKAGHTGTLDPMASGLLVLCFGEATKFSSALLEGEKTYTGIIQLGSTTTTADAEGEILESRPVELAGFAPEALAARFTGVITQVPPNFSAIKVAGKPLYAYAREGAPVEAKPRQVHIHALALELCGPDQLRFTLRCSGGTYVRSLAVDIGRALGCGAHLAALRREASGRLRVVDGASLDALEAMTEGERRSRLLPPDTAVYGLPAVVIDSVAALALVQGRPATAPTGSAAGKSRIYDGAQRFLGVAEVTGQGDLIPVRLMATGPQAEHAAQAC